MAPTGKSVNSKKTPPDTLFLANLLSEIAHFSGPAITMEDVCDRIIGRIVPLFACEGCWLLTPSRIDDKPEIRAWRGLSPNSVGNLEWISSGGNAKESSTMPVIRDFGIADAPSDLVWPNEKIGRIAISPMHIQDRYVGSIVIFLRDSRALSSRHQMLLASISSQASLVIRLIDLLLASQELVLQQERDRIAKEIHDGVSQNLALLMLKMEIISRLLESDPARVKTEIQKVMEILESTVSELRRSIYVLRSPGRME